MCDVDIEIFVKYLAPRLNITRRYVGTEPLSQLTADYNAALEASQILFSNKANETLKNIDEATLLDVFEGVPQFEISAEELKAGIPVLDLLAVKSAVFTSKGEARKMVQGGGVSINKEKIADPNASVSEEVLLNGKYILVQRGKKNYYLLIVK